MRGNNFRGKNKLKKYFTIFQMMLQITRAKIFELFMVKIILYNNQSLKSNFQVIIGCAYPMLLIRMSIVSLGCLFSYVAPDNIRQKKKTYMIYGFSPVCVLICHTRWDFCVKVHPQISKDYVFPTMCFHMLYRCYLLSWDPKIGSAPKTA